MAAFVLKTNCSHLVSLQWSGSVTDDVNDFFK